MQVRIFNSGLSCKQDAIGYINARKFLCAQIQILSNPTKELLIDYVNNKNGILLLDTGSFSSFRNGEEVPFDQVIALYRDFLSRISQKERVSLIAPDVIANQSRSLALLQKYRTAMQEFITAGAEVVVPIQQGELSLLEAYNCVIKILGTNIRVALPANKAAIGEKNLLQFINQVKPSRLHLLGIAGRPKLKKLIEQIRLIAPEIDLTADANTLRAKIGVGRKLDRAIKTELAGALEKALRAGSEGFPGQQEFVRNVFETPCYLSECDAKELARLLEPNNELAQDRIIARAAGEFACLPGFDHGSRLGDLLEQDYPPEQFAAALEKLAIEVARKKISGPLRAAAITNIVSNDSGEIKIEEEQPTKTDTPQQLSLFDFINDEAMADEHYNSSQYASENAWIIEVLEQACNIPLNEREKFAPKFARIIEKLGNNLMLSLRWKDLQWIAYQYARRFAPGHKGTEEFRNKQNEFYNRAGLGNRPAFNNIARQDDSPALNNKSNNANHLIAPKPKENIVISYGMGTESSSILLRWLTDPASRDFDLKDLIVITAMTGDEFPDTEMLVTKHILPRLRDARVRFVQVARAGHSDSDGVKVLDDSRSPKKLYMEGAYKLSEELASVGTVPQVARGRRICSLKFKGAIIDSWVKAELGEQSYRHIIGFNADEVARVERDRCYGNDNRIAEFPLVKWNWDRAKCEEFIFGLTGATWEKSACAFCPFSSGKPEVMARFRSFPQAASQALMLETISVALNPRMTLYSGKTLMSCIEKDGNQQALEAYQEQLSKVSWSIYRVRRIYAGKGRADRSVEVLATGDRPTIKQQFAELAHGLKVDPDGQRTYRLRRQENVYPSREEFLVIAPAGVLNKARGGFDLRWDIFDYSQQVAAA